MKGLGKILTYAFLMAVGCTMLLPFLWMCSSSLKPDDQIFRRNMIPTKDYVTLEGIEYEVDRKQSAPEGAGLYKVRVIRGPLRGQEPEVSSDLLTRGRGFSDFIYSPPDGETPVSVKILEKLVPMTYLVSAHAVKGEAKISKQSFSEFDIETRPAFQWANFKRAIKVSGVFGRAYINSFIVAIVITIGQVFTCSLAAYAFARLKFPFRDTLFMGYLATLMIPGAVTMIPVFIIIKTMPEILNAILSTSWFGQDLFFMIKKFNISTYVGRPIGLDSYFAIIAPGLFSAFGTFMLRQFFMSLPRDLEDAARIDGCSSWGIYCNVILPLSKPALAALTILTFLGAWRAFLWPMIVTSTPEMQVLPVMLQAFMGVTGTQWNLLMAGSLMVLAPMIIVFVFGQRFFISGIQLGAVKG